MSRVSFSSVGWRFGRYRRIVESGGGYIYWLGFFRGLGKLGEVGLYFL